MHYPFCSIFFGGRGGSGDYITFGLTTPASFTFYLAGSGTVNIDWGEGTVQPVTLNASATTYTHAAGTTVTVSNPSNVTRVYATNNANVNSVDIPDSATSMYYILLSGLTNVTSFTTHKEWTALGGMDLTNLGLSSIEVHKEWVNLNYLAVRQMAAITSVETHAEWVLLEDLVVDQTSITSLTTYNTWPLMSELNVNQTLISSIETHSTWTVFYRILAANCPNLSSVTMHPEHVNMASVFMGTNPSLTTFTAYREWGSLLILTLSGNALSPDTVINNILVEMDNAGLVVNAELHLDGGTNAAPTGVGLTARASLIAQGVKVWNN